MLTSGAHAQDHPRAARPPARSRNRDRPRWCGWRSSRTAGHTGRARFVRLFGLVAFVLLGKDTLAALTAFSALLHLLLGLQDSLLLPAGAGLLLIMLPRHARLVHLVAGRERIHHLAWAGLAIAVLIGYFAIHGSLMMDGHVDVLGAASKASEVGILLLLLREHRSASAPNAVDEAE